MHRVDLWLIRRYGARAHELRICVSYTALHAAPGLHIRSVEEARFPNIAVA